MAEKVVCVVCRRTVTGRIPKGGDGSVLVPHRHKRSVFGFCDGHLIPGKPWAASRTKIRRRRPGPPRRGPMRNPKYRRWISEHLSILDKYAEPGYRPFRANFGPFNDACLSDPCHTGRTNGMSSKSGDETLVPLTRAEHLVYDNKSLRPAFEAEVKAKTGKTIAEHAAIYYAAWLKEGNAP